MADSSWSHPPKPRPATPAGPPPRDETELPPEERRHRALLRMLGHVKDALRIDPRALYRAAALAGYNANPDSVMCSADPGVKALWAQEDAEALLAVGSDDEAER